MKKIHSLYLILPLVFLMMLPILLPPNNAVREKELIIKPSETVLYSNVLWLDNPTFEDPIEPPWYPIIQGDVSDIYASKDLNQVNYKIVGDSGVLQVDDPINSSDWTVFQNPKRPVLPDIYVISSAGAEVYHYWDENINQTRNTPSVHWKRNIEMPVNMSNYIVTSASLEVVYNATVTVSPHAISGAGIDRDGDVGLDAYAIGDFAEFYILVSDINNTQEYQLAYYQTVDLGRDSPFTPNITDTVMNTVPEEVLISLLSAALSIDDYNFTITMGIDIYCEDNEYGADDDQWDSLLFKSLNLTFAYEKKIDQFTSGSWAQDLDEISGSNVQITDANLNFKYKIDKNWTESSQNSQIRIYMNERKFEQSISLIDYVYSSSFQEARSGGYDIDEILLPYENFTLSIQVFLAEDFGLDNNITISITDVYLYVSYTETFPDPISEPFLFALLFALSAIGATVLAAYLIAYQTYLKYPVPVRKVRKYRKTLSNAKAPGVGIVSQKTSFSKSYSQEVKKTDKFLKGKPGAQKVKPEKILKEPVKKTPSQNPKLT
ncbi:MAG: hypothetical protein HWN80_13910 [Candidatus Lokiarchaeota archaeon]|nr:hypothetical protein [Candidatus Lokiarchaeota archaeon]